MTRRAFLSACGALAATRRAAARPNIVLVLADDLGWNDIGYTNPEVRTPVLDKLAASGARLAQYRTAPVCSPTRASLLAGRDPLRTGVVVPIERGTALPAREVLLPQILVDAGYQTWLVGKWHLGEIDAAHLPHRRGYQRFYGFLGGEIDYFTHRRGAMLDWWRDDEPVREDGYSTDLLADAAARWIVDRDRDKPFFLQLSFSAPHVPLQAPDDILAKWAHVADPARRAYLAAVEAMDGAVGRVYAALESEGIERDTLVVFASDNGGQTRTGGASNGSLRGAKSQAFEGGVHVPAFLAWPGVVAGGWEFGGHMTVLDWLPTLCALAGARLPDIELDGVDMWPAIVDGARVERPPCVLGTEGSWCVLDGDWKYVDHTTPAGVAQRSLFNLATDAEESRNVAAENPAIVERLSAILRDHPRGSLDRV